MPERRFAAAWLSIPGLSLAAAWGLQTARAAPGGAALEPFAAHYLVDWKTLNVGTSDLELKTDPPSGGYLYTWTLSARGIFRIVYSDDVIQRSWLSIVADHVRPQRYRAEEGASTVQINFDWDSRRARGMTEKKPVDLRLSEGTQDIMSIQVEVMLDLGNGHLPGSFPILDRDEIKDFAYADEGTGRVRTALGELDTIVVSSRREGSDRVLRMWFAPSLGFIPVQAERFHGGKLEFAMRIKSLRR